MNRRGTAASLVIGGAVVVFSGLALVSIPAAFIILAGVLLIALGLFGVEVTP